MDTHLTRRRPGRPRAEHAIDARSALLEAARELFAAQGFDGVSTKRIAQKAGVNPAMIHYYFSDKAGLQDAAFREGMEPVIALLAELSERATRPLALRDFFTVYMQTLATNPWLPRMIVRDVLPDGGRLRPLFVKIAGARIGPVVAGLIAAGRERNEVRADLDPALTTLSVASLAAFPFVALPILNHVLNLEVNEAFLDKLVTHTSDLFYQGAGVTHD